MKLALIGAVAVAAAAFATPVLAQAVVEDPSYCAKFYPNASCQDLIAGNSYRDWHNESVLMPHQATESNAYRYHGGPKYND
jgi:hypothetical protein